jgi:mono/diheme cytochrome c family protein
MDGLMGQNLAKVPDLGTSRVNPGQNKTSYLMKPMVPKQDPQPTVNRRRRSAYLDLRLLGAAASCTFLAAVSLQPSLVRGQNQAKKASKPAQSAPTYNAVVAPTVKKYCAPCHSGANAPAGISFDKLNDKNILTSQDSWDDVARNISNAHMPPDGSPKPSPAERKAMAAYIQGAMSASCKLPNPGRVTVRRLNRQEYDNTVRDLVGVEFHPAADFPSDDVGYGFDNIGDVLSVSPLLTEKYLSAAEQIAQAAIIVPKIEHKLLMGSEMTDDKGHMGDATPAALFTFGALHFSMKYPKVGLYQLRVLAAQDEAGPEAAKMAVEIDGKEVERVDVTGSKTKPEDFVFPVKGDGADHHYALRFLNDYYNAKDPPGKQDRNLYVESAELIGPLSGDGGLSDSHRRIMIADPKVDGKEVAARKILRNFATRAYRRPATDDEIDRLMKLFHMSDQAGQSFEESIQIGVEAVLVSPNFLFRIEREPSSQIASTNALNDYEIASRLSYFLWASMPDDRLMELARKGKLHQPLVLDKEAARMLEDPRAHTLADNFAGQWLELRKLQTFTPAAGTAPDWNDALRAEMTTETKMFFNRVVGEDRSVLDFLDGKYTYVNEDLAKHYDIKGVYGPEFQLVALNDGIRAGVLTQGAILSVTSNPTRTSPTKRGKWVLDQLLGTPPPPPPPGVGTINDEGHLLKASTLRELMQEHRKNPACAACHARMDPIGFGLENFDPTGKWRTLENGKFPIDASGVLPDGRKFNGPAELRDILMSNKDGFVRCLTEKLLTYALGRGVDGADKCAVDKIVTETKAKQYRFSGLVDAIVNSDAFRLRGKDGATQ